MMSNKKIEKFSIIVCRKKRLVFSLLTYNVLRFENIQIKQF